MVSLISSRDKGWIWSCFQMTEGKHVVSMFHLVLGTLLASHSVAFSPYQYVSPCTPEYKLMVREPVQPYRSKLRETDSS